ncbi:hypothetical protein ACQP3L_36450, partial [Escherichia coli]
PRSSQHSLRGEASKAFFNVAPFTSEHDTISLCSFLNSQHAILQENKQIKQKTKNQPTKQTNKKPSQELTTGTKG